MDKISVKERRLLLDIRELVLSTRNTAVRTVNTLQVKMNFEIGRLIVEHEQVGAKRAAYGKALMKNLSVKLAKDFGRGFSEDNLSHMRRFYSVYQKENTEISETLSRKFTLSWSHYVFLMSIADENERSFYEIETHQQNWSLREMRHQFNSGLYERLALSRNKKEVRNMAKKGQVVSKPEDMLKEPYVLEFLGLDEKTNYSESDLETAIINKLEHFLLELGKGFLFESRQKRFTFAEEHFFIDLVFYNRLLHCYVLIDLKIGKLTHQDLGQMQMYVNYFDRYVKKQNERHTIGIVLCKEKHDALVKITLPKDTTIYAKEYKLYLPSKRELKQKLLDWGGK